MRPTENEVRIGLAEVFAGCNVFEVEEDGDITYITATGGCVVLKYSDMRKIVEVLGTERVWFSSLAGRDAEDSVSFDGCVMYIKAMYT